MLTRAYAQQIAKRWNAPSPPHYAGFVTEFHLDARYASRFETHVVGTSQHRELWVAAELLEEFNDHIVGRIALVAAFYGSGYVGPVPLAGVLEKATAREQLLVLERIRNNDLAQFVAEIKRQQVLVLLNFAYWVRTDLAAYGLPEEHKAAVLRAVHHAWADAFIDDTLIGAEQVITPSSGK